MAGKKKKTTKATPPPVENVSFPDLMDGGPLPDANFPDISIMDSDPNKQVIDLTDSGDTEEADLDDVLLDELLDGDASVPTTLSSSVSSDDPSARDLLRKANIRIEHQHLLDQIHDLKEMLKGKDEQIEKLNGQLQRATTTKCDLVLAHSELEICHEHDIQRKEMDTKAMHRRAMQEKEMRAVIEMEFMNEIVKLNVYMQELEKRYQNCLLEKDFEYAELFEECRKLKVAASRGQSARRDTDRKKRNEFKKQEGTSVSA